MDRDLSSGRVFLRKDSEGVTQVFGMPLGGGEASPVTQAKRAVRSFLYSVDGKSIAYTMTDAETDASTPRGARPNSRAVRSHSG